jgi:hypothetical protein
MPQRSDVVQVGVPDRQNRGRTRVCADEFPQPLDRGANPVIL